MPAKKFWWLFVISWCAMIFLPTALLAFTAAHTGVALEHATEMPINQVDSLNFVLRKSVHVSLFGILAVLLLGQGISRSVDPCQRVFALSQTVRRLTGLPDRRLTDIMTLS